MPGSTTADVQQAYVGYVYGDSTSGQPAVYGVGLTGIPVFNVNNNCSTGSSALLLARQAVETRRGRVRARARLRADAAGRAEGAYDDRPTPMARFADTMIGLQGWDDEAPRAAQMFGGAGREYIEQHGIRRETFARISVKARQHAANNPFAVFRNTVTLDEVLAAPMVFDPLTRFQCCPPTCGAAAAVVCSEDFARRTGSTRGVRIAAQAMTTDMPSTFDSGDMRKVVGYDMARAAAHEGLRGGRHRARGHRRRRAARLLHRQRAAHLRGARPHARRHGREVHLGRRQHLRRPRRHQPVRRPAVQGPSARRDRPRAVHRAGVAAARPGRAAPGRGRAAGAAAQPRPRWRLRRHSVRESPNDRPPPRWSSRCRPSRCRSKWAACASSRRRPANIDPDLHRRSRRTRCRASRLAGAADVLLLPGDGPAEPGCPARAARHRLPHPPSWRAAIPLPRDGPRRRPAALRAAHRRTSTTRRAARSNSWCARPA